MPNLQAPTRLCGRTHLPRPPPLESNRRRAALSFGPPRRRLDLLWPRFAPHLDPNTFALPHPAPAPRTKALPNLLPAHFLDHAPPVATLGPCSLHPHGAAHSRPRRPLLAKQLVVASALLVPVAGHCPHRSTSHGLRPRRLGTRVPVPHRLGSHSTQHINYVLSQTPPLSRFRPPTPRPVSPLDAPPAHSSRNARYPLCDISTRRRIKPTRQYGER